jgi:hypothetical protein
MSEEGENKNDKWITVTGNGKSKKILNPKPKPKLHKAFATLTQLNAPTYYNLPSPTQQMDDDKTIILPGPQEHRRQQKKSRCQHIKQTLRQLCQSDDLFLDNSITHAKDKHNAIAKGNTNNAKCVAINSAHLQCNQPTIRLAQRGRNMACHLGSAFNWTIKKLNKNKLVSFSKQNMVHLFGAITFPSIMLTYDSGANGHYISKQDQRKAGLPILQPSTQRVGVANGGTSNAKYVIQLTFCKLSAQSMQADTFQDFPTSLMSMGKTSDNGTVSVFTKEGINSFKEEDVFITCKGKPILIGVQQIPLMQQQGHWQPRHPSKQVSTVSSQQRIRSPINAVC